MLGQNTFVVDDAKALAALAYPYSERWGRGESWEAGAAVLHNPAGRRNFLWKASAVFNKDTGIFEVFAKRADSQKGERVFVDADVRELDFSFDQNMSPAFVYRSFETVKLRFFDASQGDYVTLEFEEIKDPKICLDDKRTFNLANSNVVFAYMRKRTLFMRLQKDRFGVEYELKTFACDRKLWRIGMGEAGRFLFVLK